MTLATLFFIGIHLFSLVICAVMLLEFRRMHRMRVVLLEGLEGKSALQKDRGWYMFFISYVVTTIVILLGSSVIFFLPSLA